MCFPVSFAKYLRTHFYKKHFWWLLLYYAVTWLSLDAFRTLSNIYGTFCDNNFEFCKNTHHRCLTKMYVWYINWSYIRRSEDIQDVFWTSYVRPMYLQLCPAHVFHVLHRHHKQQVFLFPNSAKKAELQSLMLHLTS